MSSHGTTTRAMPGRCENHAGDHYAPRCDACAAVDSDELAARQAEETARNAQAAADDMRAGRWHSALAHLGIAAEACSTARLEARRASSTTTTIRSGKTHVPGQPHHHEEHR